nr:hypothetical protein [uncultured Kingella sp.]
MIRRWLALTYYLYALRLAALSHFYFNRLYCSLKVSGGRSLRSIARGSLKRLGSAYPPYGKRLRVYQLFNGHRFPPDSRTGAARPQRRWRG